MQLRYKLCCVAAIVAVLTGVPARAAGVPFNSVFIEDLTSKELRDRVARGSTTVLVPIGGTEQNGPHIALGKHNVRVKYLAGLIAQRLGNAVVAPVLSYVPEGAVFPPVAHMRFTGTITIPDATFESILESTAKSFKQHGLHTVIFLGDHGGYQKSEKRAVDKINKAWASDPTAHAYALSAYYEAAQTSFVLTLRKKGFSDAEIGLHAGLLDTSLTLAVDPTLVRTELLAQGAKATPAEGVYGDPRRSTAELGQVGVQMIVEESAQAIQRLAKQP